MNPLSSNQRDKNFDLFGLLANRFLYSIPRSSGGSAPGSSPSGRTGGKKAGRGERAGHLIPHDEVSRTGRESKERQKKFLKLLQKNIARYNADYGDDAANKKEDVVYTSIDQPTSFENLTATKAQIKEIRKEMIRSAGEEWRESLASDSQFQFLNGLLEVIEEVEKLPDIGGEEVIEAHRGRLHRRFEKMNKAAERREGWEKRPVYQALNGTFESLSGTEAFKGVWQTPEGFSNQAQREARELFIAMMAEKTNDFKNRFVLGEGFTNEVEQNIKNFPFIYNEFLKYEGAGHKDAVSLEAIAAAESAVNEANRKLIGVNKAEDIIERNKQAGISVSQLPPEAPIPSTAAWDKRLRALNGMIYRLEEKAAKDGERYPALKPGWVEAAGKLKVHAAKADAYLKLSDLKDSEKNVRSKFTRIELSHPARRKMVMELAMKKFVKAMDMVDNPHSNANWQQFLHPTVRRMAIANIYETGVATYKEDTDGNVTYEENIKGETTWMLSALALSDYFNFKEVGEEMDASHWAVLRATYLGGKIAVLLENLKPTERVLEDWIEVRRGADEEIMEVHPPDLVKRFEKYNEAQLLDMQGQVKNNRKRLEGFLKKTKAAVKEPYSEKSQEFIKAMRSGDYDGELANDIGYLGKISAIGGASLKAYDHQMNHLQINFKTAELHDRNDLMFFEGLGMNIEGLEPAYLAMIQKNPKLRAEYWDELLLGSDAEFKKLIGLFKVIIPSGIAGGKEDFIQGLVSLRKKYKGEKTMTKLQSHLTEGSEDAVVLSVFRMLKVHLSRRAESAAAGERQLKDIEKRLGGVHIGDKISNYVGGVWDMLTGPGQSMANRAAGLVLIYGLYKSARLAMKGEGSSGKALRALFVAGAVEIAAKEITGRGVLDRLGLDAIAGAMEGTYEAVLLQDAEKNMEDKAITPEAHSAALFELNDVPFNQVVEWYDSSDNNGMPKKAKGAKDLFPSQINLNKIGPKVTWDVKDKKLEARRVVWETVRHFFKYVGNKDNKRGEHHGKEALKERWITMVDKPSHKMVHSTYDHREWLKATGVKKNDINWQMVMRAEIDPREVDLTKGKTPVGKLEATAKEWYGEVSEWARQYVYNPGSGYAEVFLDDMGEHAQDTKKFFSEVAETTKRKLYFGKEKVILWYGEHQYEIRRVAEDHWNLLVTGVKMPFKIVYAVDQWAIPWSLSKLRQIEETLRPDKLVTVDRELHAGDISTAPAHLNSPNAEVNPNFRYFGVYQESFLNALRDPEDRTVNKPKPWFYRDQGLDVGYFISEVSVEDAGLSPDDPLYSGSPQNVHSKLVDLSRKQAKDMFFQKGKVSDEEIKNYMYSIHKVVKTTDPKKVYIFWRMPLDGSAELHLKSTGRWADYMNPNKHRDRDAFEVDPSQTSWENLKEAFALDMDPVRKVLTSAGGYAAQVPAFVFWNIEGAGSIIKVIGAAFGKDEKFGEAVDAVANRPPAQRQFIDELFTSASSQHKALSNFYKDPINAKLYAFALDMAHKNEKPLFLGIMKDRTGLEDEAYEGTHYLDHPNEQQAYQEMWDHYQHYYLDAEKTDEDIEDAIREKMENPPEE